ncbi:nucleotide sugar dehydrogenase [Arthrobacter sp. 179]|uniref:nucleotide sugar dehydrogenase n=1 Tax=Arthrobacter sp. 179 TaxID=3457734 RepID=UPI00403337CE
MAVTKELDLVVIGQGYVGLPLAQEAVRAGLKTVGFDLNPRIVNGLNNGTSHIDDLTNDDIGIMLDAGFEASTNPGVLAKTKTVVICVPTPLSDDGAPDMTYVISAAETAARNIEVDTLISMESTTYPGTTEDLLKPMFESNGRRVGTDIFLSYSPERINPGDPVYGFRNTPKVVGGITSSCLDRAKKFYSQIVDTVVPVSGTREAETAKLLENTYRHVNIALVNELAQAARGLGVDLFEVIDAAKTKPFGFQAFYPGPGVGGHCIPIDPNYLSYTIKKELGHPFRFVELAQEINSSMPSHVRTRIAEILNDAGKPVKGSNVLLLGVTYKSNIADQRESPAVPLARLLSDHQCDLSFHDPLVSQWRVAAGLNFECVGDLDQALASADLVVLLQDHAEYRDLRLEGVSCPVLDTRGVLPRQEGVVHM